jgi:beta-fructofuranosidase
MTDPAFPVLHGRPARGWLNDPNGCSYVDGRYHVFFQHNPDAPVHAAIKWGHASSADLVTWRQEPIALVNRPGELDQHGCWTGCVVVDDGTPTAVYSAVADDTRRSEVLLARSDRHMLTWRQGRRSAAGMPADPAVTDVRDPFVFEFGGHRYAVQGAGHRQGDGRILVYGCDDLAAWTYLGAFLTGDDALAAVLAPANVWECPNLVRFGDRWVLIFSLLSHRGDAISLDGVRYLVGDVSMGPDGPRFAPASGGCVDAGPSFYAPQVLCRPERTLMWAWSPEGSSRTAADMVSAGWAGALTFCRELALDGDALVSRPVPELAALRRGPLEVAPGEVFRAAAFDLEIDSGAATLSLVDGVDETPVASLKAPARILVDGSLVETFGAGAAPFTTRAYPTARSGWILRLARPAAVTAWRLGPPG